MNLLFRSGKRDDARATGLFACLPKLQTLLLKDNTISADGAEALAANLKYIPLLKNLDLSQNRIRAVGASALAARLRDIPELMALNLADNNIGAGAGALASCLKDVRQLQTLNLRNTGIDTDGAKALAALISVNHVIKTLDLGGNNITITGIKYLSKALMSNQVIHSMNMKFSIDLLGDAGYDCIAYYIHRNTKLIQDLATFITNCTSVDFNNPDLDNNVKFIVSNIKYFKAFQVVDQSALWSCVAKTSSKETIQDSLDNFSTLILKSFGLDKHITVPEVVNIIHDFVGSESLWPFTETSAVSLSGNHQVECCTLL